MKFQHLFWSTTLLLLTACTTPAYFSVPNQRFQSPTVSGETLKGEVAIGAEHPTYVVTVKDITATPPDISGAEITRTAPDVDINLVVDLHIGLGSQFDVSFDSDFFHVKYQFMGSSRKEAKEHEWVGAMTLDEFNDSSETTSDSTAADKYKLEANGYGASLIVGYRTTKETYPYVNLNYLDFSAKTDVTQTATVFKYNDSGTQFGFLLGLRHETPKGMYGSLEWSYSKTKWANLEPRELGSIGYIIGYAW
jgi:hypothetical protein